VIGLTNIDKPSLWAENFPKLSITDYMCTHSLVCRIRLFSIQRIFY